MKKFNLVFAALLLAPAIAITSAAVASQSTNGAANSSASSSATTGTSVTTSTSSGSDTDNSNSQSQSENGVQTQTGNPEVGIMTQAQTEANIEEQIQESKSTYSPKNAQATARMSAVATAVESLIRISNSIENQGIGDQIREIAQTQTKNQDKINQSIDKAETRTGIAKFFIGANYGELKIAKAAMVENQNKITELKTLMTQVTSDADKLEIANQILVLQEESLALRDQLELSDDGFSLFGWFSRWMKKY